MFKKERSKFMEEKKVYHRGLYHLLCKKCLNYKLMGTIAMYLLVLIPYTDDQCWRNVTRPNKYFVYLLPF